MFRNYLITAWRNVVKNGVFSIINIFGLAVGLMSCILILLFVRQETGYDTWIKDSDRLVRLHTAYTTPNREPFLTVRSAGRMMEAVRDYAQNEVESGVRLIQFGITVRQEANVFPEQVTMVDGNFFEIFQLPFKHGSIDSSFNKPMDLVITESMAFKYFGRTDAIGETLTVCCVSGNTATLTVTGVIEDLPDATHLNTELLVYLQPALFPENDNVLNTWNSVNVYTYFKMKPDVTVDQLQQRISYWANNESPFVQMLADNGGGAFDGMKVTDVVKHRVMSVPDLHLHAIEHAGNLGDLTPMGDQRMINTFIVVACLVLVIACINFMNLSTAKASKRAREVVMRKVLGASRAQVAVQFLGEAIALVLIALLFALVAVELVLPYYSEVLGTNLTLNLFSEPTLLLSLIAMAIVVGIGAGIYPALYLSRFLPSEILKASKGSESASSAKLRSLLVVMQFATSIVLVISTLVVYGQTVFSNNLDVGYQSDNKLVLNVRPARDNLASLKQELMRISEVSSVVFSSEAPTQDNENNNFFQLVGTDENGTVGQEELLNYHHMDYGFFEAYQIEPLAGRLFSEAFGTDEIRDVAEGETGSASVILNASAAKKLGFSDPQQAIGKTLAANVNGPQHLTVIGVIPDIYFRSVKFGVRPSTYMLNPQRYNVASISFNTTNVANLMSQVESVWKQQVPMEPLNLQFLSEMMAAQYEDEVTTAKLFLVFSVLAIVVASLGLYGLSAFTVERRTKEIGIRKVMGAEVKDVVKLLVWQFSKPVAMANVIAWPIATYAMLSWLERFPYRIENYWLIPIFISVGLFSLLVAWLTVGGNAAAVARKNPVVSLRYE